jgi:hypothetical protein
VTVEDRITPVLWLELSPVAADDAATVDRATVLSSAPGVERVTRWRDVMPGRRDLPRRLPDAASLIVAEATPTFTPAPIPDEVVGLHFARTLRPGQGRLTGRPTIGLSLVLISAEPVADAQALRDWADFVHLDHIAAVGVPGYTMITPYELVGGGAPRFLHFYEMDTDDPEAAFKAMTPLVVKRLGPRGTPDFDDWAFHPALRIDYVSSFALVGEHRA